MPRGITCLSCGVSLLAMESLGPVPIGRDDCPKCGGDEFEFVE